MLQGWAKTYDGLLREHLRDAHARRVAPDRLARRGHGRGRAKLKVWRQNSVSFSRGGQGVPLQPRDGHRRGDGTAGWRACAMGNQGCWVEAGMLVLPRGTHLLPICVFACLAGIPSATDHLLHGVRQQRQRGLSGSSAGIAARSRLCLPWLWCALMDSLHSYEHLWHFVRTVHAAGRSR